MTTAIDMDAEVKERALNEAAAEAAELHRLDTEREAVRRRFLTKLHTARMAGAIQQEIADRTGFSRQRISQFLNE